MNYRYYTLPNGIRVAHLESLSPVAHCGITINAGSRDEKDHEQGLAHFIEHLIFKGTKRRKMYQILSHMENVGGDINAYTTKEETCIYASFLTEYYGRCLDLLSDILFNSTFPEKAIRNEREVVLDEINSYKDNPGEQIIDDFDEILFKQHSLGKNILGTPQKLKKFDHAKILDFIEKNYSTHEMVICSVGNIKFDKLVTLAEKYFGHFPERVRKNQRTPFNSYSPSTKEIKRDNHQAHCVIGNLGFSSLDDNKINLILLNNLLGGPGLNSRLNMGIREKYGYCYHIESNYQPYSDTGAFYIYLGTDNGHLEKTINLVNKELKKLTQEKLGSLQLKRAKQQLKGQAAICYESNINKMLSMGKSVLLRNKVDTLEDIYKRIDAITSSHLIEVANEVLDHKMLSMLTYKPK